MLRVKNISRPGLASITFDVPEGQCLAVTGPSGAGKSLLLRAIADLDPNCGNAWVGGTSRREVLAPAWRRLAGFVPAESGWWADRVGEHFAAAEPAMKLVEELGLPPEALEWQVQRLSTGERHRLALARALSLEPKVLLLDEPTAALDSDATRQFEKVLKRLLKAGVAAVVVTHDEKQVARLAGQVVRMEYGKAVGPVVVA